MCNIEHHEENPMRVKVDSVLWQFAKLYHKKYLADHPGRKIGLGALAISVLLAFEKNGDAVRQEDTRDSVTWKATPQFLNKTRLEAGPLVTLGPGVH